MDTAPERRRASERERESESERENESEGESESERERERERERRPVWGTQSFGDATWFDGSRTVFSRNQNALSDMYSVYV